MCPNFTSCVILVFSCILLWNINKSYYDNKIINLDNISCMSKDGETYIYQIKNIKLDISTKQADWLIHTNLLFGFMIECHKHKYKYIKNNIKKIFYNVMKKENITIDTTYTYYENKPYIALLKKISDI